MTPSIIFRPICWLITLWDIIKIPSLLSGMYIDGHDSKEISDDGKTQVLRCKRCSLISKAESL